MYGDNHYKYVGSGSIATSAATTHALLGAFNGLSLLNSKEVVHMQAYTTGATAVVGPKESISNSVGFHLLPSASMVDFPPLTVSALNGFGLVRFSGTNPTVYWTLWKRVG